MTMKLKNLSTLAYGNGFTLWHYNAFEDDTIAIDYFDPAYDILKQGDMILISSRNFGRIVIVSKIEENCVTLNKLSV